MKTTAEYRAQWLRDIEVIKDSYDVPKVIRMLIADVEELEAKIKRGSRRVDLLTGRRVEMEQGDEDDT